MATGDKNAYSRRVSKCYGHISLTENPQKKTRARYINKLIIDKRKTLCEIVIDIANVN